MEMGGQIVDATLVSAPKQRNAQDEKAEVASVCRTAWRLGQGVFRLKFRLPESP